MCGNAEFFFLLCLSNQVKSILLHTSRFFVVEPKILCRGEIGLKFNCLAISLLHTS